MHVSILTDAEYGLRMDWFSSHSFWSLLFLFSFYQYTQAEKQKNEAQKNEEQAQVQSILANVRQTSEFRPREAMVLARAGMILEGESNTGRTLYNALRRHAFHQDTKWNIYGHQSTILDLQLSKDGRRMVSVSDGGEAIVWDLEGKKTTYLMQQNLPNRPQVQIPQELSMSKSHLINSDSRLHPKIIKWYCGVWKQERDSFNFWVTNQR